MVELMVKLTMYMIVKLSCAILNKEGFETCLKWKLRPRVQYLANVETVVTKRFCNDSVVYYIDHRFYDLDALKLDDTLS